MNCTATSVIEKLANLANIHRNRAKMTTGALADGETDYAHICDEAVTLIRCLSEDADAFAEADDCDDAQIHVKSCDDCREFFRVGKGHECGKAVSCHE